MMSLLLFAFYAMAIVGLAFLSAAIEPEPWWIHEWPEYRQLKKWQWCTVPARWVQ